MFDSFDRIGHVYPILRWLIKLWRIFQTPTQRDKTQVLVLNYFQGVATFARKKPDGVYGNNIINFSGQIGEDWLIRAIQIRYDHTVVACGDKLFRRIGAIMQGGSDSTFLADATADIHCNLTVSLLPRFYAIDRRYALIIGKK